MMFLIGIANQTASPMWFDTVADAKSYVASTGQSRATMQRIRLDGGLGVKYRYRPYENPKWSREK